MEYLPLPTTEQAIDRSRLEAMQRGAGLQPGAMTMFWHTTIRHPVTNQVALVVQIEGDKEYMTASEITNLLSEALAEVMDWFLEFEHGV